jgi:hypothetical protein
MFSENQNGLPVVLSEYFAGETGRPNQVDRIEEIGAWCGGRGGFGSVRLPLGRVPHQSPRNDN